MRTYIGRVVDRRRRCGIHSLFDHAEHGPWPRQREHADGEQQQLWRAHLCCVAIKARRFEAFMLHSQKSAMREAFLLLTAGAGSLPPFKSTIVQRGQSPSAIKSPLPRPHGLQRGRRSAARKLAAGGRGTDRGGVPHPLLAQVPGIDAGPDARHALQSDLLLRVLQVWCLLRLRPQAGLFGRFIV